MSDDIKLNANSSNEVSVDPESSTEMCDETSELATNTKMEETIIDNLTSFLEANGAMELDKEVLRCMAVSLTKRFHDTSPGTLHDVKMDNPYGVGYHSPCVSLQTYQGSTSPAVQGRSVREFEEQMATLRKENFNLKLRLYFIEESIPGYHQVSNTTEGQETLMKQLIDSKVEMEILRKEIKEKQQLLQDAARAISHIENLLKDTEIKHEEELNDLKQKLDFYESKYEMDKSHTTSEDLMQRSQVVENLNALQRIRELEDLLRQSETKLQDFQTQIHTLDEILAKRDETIREYEDKVKELVFQNNELLESSENKDKDAANNEIQQQLNDDLQKYKIELADKACMIMDLEDRLKNRDSLYEKACLTIQKLMLNIKSQKTEITQLKEHHNQTNNNKSGSQQQNENSASGGVGLSTLECTGFCRSLSDTEALQDLNATQKQKYEHIIEQQETTIQNLKADVKKKTADLQNLVNKELWEKNREIERLNRMLSNKTTSPSAVANDSGNNEPLQQSFSEIEFNKAVQRNKLLQRKVDILMQRLDTERSSDTVITQLRNDLKKARDDAEAAEKWRRECSEFCSILATRLEELAGFLNSLLKHKDVLGFLAVEKRKAMRRAVDRSLDLSKSFNMTLSVTGISMIDQSLTELTNLSGLLDAFEAGLTNETFNSHEDLNNSTAQSMEILKAENKALQRELEKRRLAEGKKERRSLPLSVMVENRESESEAWSEPDRKVSMARIGLEDHSGSLKVAKEQPAVQQTETDSDCSASGQLDRSSAKTRTQERITHLEQVIQQKDKRIIDLQCQLVEANNRAKLEASKVVQLTQEMEEMKKRNQELHDDLVAIGSTQEQPAGSESMLMQELSEKNQLLDKVQEEKERLTVESRLAEMQINSMKSEMEEMKDSYEMALTRAVEKEKQLVAMYEECKQQLLELQKQFTEAQRSIECLQENEQELKQTLVESEMAARNLQKQIDESTLNASKAATERVKVLNEKVQIERRLIETTHQLGLYQVERTQLQQRVKCLEDDQKKMEQRLVEAEASAKQQKTFSGYTSEEVAMMVHSSSARVAQTLMGEQRINNSSPDLGIESDAGRVSSVEMSSVQRPLLKTVEIKTDGEIENQEENLNSSVENEKPLNTASPVKKHDCAKVDQEIADLRRKLLRTKRAFEETYEKLRNSNQRKAQIEKDIKNQILKTHNVLRNVRSNMENENAPSKTQQQPQHK